MWHSDDGHGFSDILANVCQNSSQSIISCTGSLCFEKEVQQAVSMQLPHGPTALSCPASPTFLQRLWHSSTDPWLWPRRSTHFLSTAYLGHAGLFTFSICGNFTSFCLTQKCPRTYRGVVLPSLWLTHCILVVCTVISPCGRFFCGAVHLYVPPGFPEME